MPERNLVYFVSDVHLGLDVNDPADREARFVSFLESVPKDTTLALYMLGDIWDFWYEYRDIQSFAELHQIFIDVWRAQDDSIRIHGGQFRKICASGGLQEGHVLGADAVGRNVVLEGSRELLLAYVVVE